MPQPKPSACRELERLSADLDLLIRDAGLGHQSQAAWERWADEGRRIARGIDTVCRGPQRRSAPVLKRTEHGVWL